MKLNKKVISILSLSIMSSTVALAQLKPGPPNQPNPPPVLTPGPPGQTTPPPPVKRQLDPRRLEEIVKRSAEIYTRDVLEIIGEAYNVRYNIRQGIMQGKARIGDYDVISNVQRSPIYNSAVQTGQARGNSEGLSAGIRTADNSARSMADADIGADVDLAINTQTAISFKPNPRSAPFAGIEANISFPATVQIRWSNDRTNKESQIQRVMFNRLPYELFRYVFDLTSLYREDVVVLPETFRGDNAIRNFLANTLGTNNMGQNEARQFYREISDGNIYENPQQNQRLFESAFLSYYNRGVEFNWYNRVQSTNFSARNLGETFYTQDAEAFANDLGQFDGYRATFRSGTVSGFNSEIINAYNRNYQIIKNSVQTSSYITQIQANVAPEQDGRTEFTVGDTFDIVLNAITNRGMIAADVKIDILDNGNVKSMNQTTTLNVPGLTRISNLNRFVRLGWIADMSAPDETATVTGSINGQSISAQFKVTFEETIRRISSTPDANMANFLANKASAFIKAQYDDLSGFKDQYKNRRPDMLLVRVRALFDNLTEAQKNQLRANGQAIRNAFGGKPSKFLNPKRNEWDEAQKMINEMQLAGKVP